MTDLLLPSEEVTSRLATVHRPPFTVVLDVTDYPRLTSGAPIRAGLARREPLVLERRGVGAGPLAISAWFWVRELAAAPLEHFEKHPQAGLVSWSPGLHAGRRVLPDRPVAWAGLPLNPDVIIPPGYSPEVIAGFLAHGEADLSLTHLLANARSQHLLRPRSSP